MQRFSHTLLGLLVGVMLALGNATSVKAQPSPLIAHDKKVDWFFVYKFNAKSFPRCAANVARACPFGGSPKAYSTGFGQQYVVASSEKALLSKGDGGCLGDTETDPVGATFDEIYNGNLYYVVWNDQFYNDPKIAGCGTSCASPWGHSKGVVAWDDQGRGLVMQVTTPSWPGAGNHAHPRTDGNSLGCVTDNNVLVAQHFFSVRLSPDDVVAVLKALATASVVTDPTNPQIVRNGGPAAIAEVASNLGQKSAADRMFRYQLTAVAGIQLLSKPAKLHASPWHLISSTLGSVDLRVATWWNHNDIPDTAADVTPDCWPTDGNWKAPGAVVNAQTGHWNTVAFGLLGTGSASGNHAKIGVSTSGTHPYTIFADMNQEGALSGSCGAKQNGRGGIFFVVENKSLHDDVANLLSNGPPTM
jgi:Deoxyribonuclease II